MKSFKELSRTQKIITVAAGLLAGVFFFFDGPGDEYSENGEYSTVENSSYPESNQTGTSNTGQAAAFPATQSAAKVSGEGKVVVYDQGLQIPRGSYVLPEGWKLVQDIATDPSTGKYLKYKLDFVGPQEELMRGLGTAQYSPMFGTHFERSWRQNVMAGLQGVLTQVTLGNLQPSESMQRNKLMPKYQQIVARQGNQLQCLEAPITGNRNGQMYRGMVRLAHITSVSAPNMGGVITASYFISPEPQFSQTLQLTEQIENTYEINPAYEQRIQQINQQVMQRQAAEHNQRMANSQAAHQQRMANNQAMFNAHQQRMREMSQINDASNARWMENFRNSGSYSSSGNTGYSNHDAFIDQIHEQSTFSDPYSGQDVQLDGQYDYNYTNGLGDYYRTNDPSFDPNALQGDWQPTEPLSPNY